MNVIAFFVEEPSAEEFLKLLVPRIVLRDIKLRFVVFSGKQDLEKQLVRRMSLWQAPNTKFVVMRDQDMAECQTVKQGLHSRCVTACRNRPFLVRIACRELESFYLGDLSAVEKGLNSRGIARLQDKKLFRNPDDIVRPSEELFRVTKGCYQKLAGTRSIAPFLSLEGNRSKSFNGLIAGIRKLTNSF